LSIEGNTLQHVLNCSDPSRTQNALSQLHEVTPVNDEEHSTGAHKLLDTPEMVVELKKSYAIAAKIDSDKFWKGELAAPKPMKLDDDR
jgi:hypothetical protein